MDFARGMLDLLSQANPNIAAALVTATVNFLGYAITAAVALVGYVYTQRRTQARAIADAHRPEKIEVYEHFLWIVRSIQYSVTGEGEKREKTKKEKEELTTHYREFTRGLIEWGSPAVIKEFKAFRKKAKLGGKTVVFAMDDMIGAIREDLGLSNRGLKRGDLLDVLIKDPESWQRDQPPQRENEGS